jgi:hypothetical protein
MCACLPWIGFSDTTWVSLLCVICSSGPCVVNADCYCKLASDLAVVIVHSIQQPSFGMRLMTLRRTRARPTWTSCGEQICQFVTAICAESPKMLATKS